MTPGREQPRQPGASCFRDAARQKGCKNLSWGPTTGWLLSWEPSGSGHIAEQDKHHCVLHLSVLSCPRRCFSFYCSCRTLTHGPDTFHFEFSVSQGGSKQQHPSVKMLPFFPVAPWGDYNHTSQYFRSTAIGFAWLSLLAPTSYFSAIMWPAQNKYKRTSKQTIKKHPTE